LGVSCAAFYDSDKQLATFWKHGLMMFLLASILMRLERLFVSYCKPFDALAGKESAWSATIFIVTHLLSLRVSAHRTPTSLFPHPAPTPALAPS
jgi:hypothetical protein